MWYTPLNASMETLILLCAVPLSWFKYSFLCSIFFWAESRWLPCWQFSWASDKVWPIFRSAIFLQSSFWFLKTLIWILYNMAPTFRMRKNMFQDSTILFCRQFAIYSSKRQCGTQFRLCNISSFICANAVGFRDSRRLFKCSSRRLCGTRFRLRNISSIFFTSEPFSLLLHLFYLFYLFYLCHRPL